MLSQDSHIVIKNPTFAKKEEYNGTYIRHLMQVGMPWKHLVPHAVEKIIQQVGGIERIKMLAGSDSNPQRW